MLLHNIITRHTLTIATLCSRFRQNGRPAIRTSRILSQPDVHAVTVKAVVARQLADDLTAFKIVQADHAGGSRWVIVFAYSLGPAAAPLAIVLTITTALLADGRVLKRSERIDIFLFRPTRRRLQPGKGREPIDEAWWQAEEDDGDQYQKKAGKE